MADTHTEVFRADVKVNVTGILGGKTGALAQFDKLAASAKELKTALDGLSSIKVSFRQAETDLERFKDRIDEIGFGIGKGGSLSQNLGNTVRDMERFAVIFRDTFRDIGSTADAEMSRAAAIIGTTTQEIIKLFQRLETSSPDVFKSLVDSAQSAGDKIVFRSIIPDMIKEIIKEFDRIPPAFEAGTEKLKGEFQELKQDVGQAVRFDDLLQINDFTEVSQALDLVEKAFGQIAPQARTAGLVIKDAMNEVQKAIVRAEVSGEKLDFLHVINQIERAQSQFARFDAEGKAAFLGVAEAVNHLETTVDPSIIFKRATQGLVDLEQELRQFSKLSREVSEPGDIKILDAEGLKEQFFELESGIRRLFDKSSPEVIEFRNELIKLRAEFKTLGQIGGASAEQVGEKIRELSATLLDLQDVDAGKKLQADLDKADRAADKAAQKQAARDDKRTQKIGELVDRIKSIDEAGTTSTNRLGQAFRGLSLAINQPGLRLQGLREAFVGTNASTNLFVRGIDRLIARGNSLSKIEQGLIKSASELSAQISKNVGSLKDQANQFRLLNQAELDNVGASEELNKRLTKLQSAFDQVVVSAESGQDISRSLIRAQRETEKLQEEYERLRRSGLLPLGSESERVFRNIVQQARNQESALQAVAARYNANRKAAQEAGDAAEESGKRAQGIFGRLSLTLGRTGSLFGSFGKSFKVSLGPLGTLNLNLTKLFGTYDRVSTEAKQAAQAVEESGRAANKASLSFEGLGKVVAAAFAGGALGGLAAKAAGGLAAAIIPDPQEFVAFGSVASQESKRIAASLGEPIEAATRFGDVIKDVFQNNFGEGAEDIGQATQVMASAMQRFGDFTDEALSANVQNLFRLRDTFQTDHNDVVNSAAELVRVFGISWEDSFDLITKGFQRGLNKSGDFLDTLSEYAVQFHDGGLNAAEFFSVLDTGLAGGVLGTDKAADAFKEFRVRIQDGSELTATSLNQIGINSEDLLNKLGSGQITAGEAFQFVLDKLRAVEDENVRMIAGVGLIGTQFEDLGQSVVQGLSTTATSIEDIRGSTNSLDIQYQTFGNTLEQIRRNFILAFDATPLFALLTQLAGPLATFSGQLGALTSQLFAVLNNVVTGIANMVNGVLYGTGQITGVFGNMVAAVASLLGGDFSLATSFMANAVNEAAVQVSIIINDLIANGFAWGSNFMVELGNGIIDAASAVLDAVISIAESIYSFLAPGSPPQQGPLSTIDQWGSGLLATFGGGFDSANADFLADALSPIAESLKENFEDDALERFQSVKDKLAEVITGIEATGQIDQDAFREISQTIGDPKVTAELERQLEMKARLSSANKKVADIEAEIAAAAEQGFVPAELREKLAAAQAEAQAVEEENKQIEQQQRATDRITQLEEQLKEEKEEGAVAAIAGAAAAAGAGVKGQEKLRAAAAETHKQLLADLEARFKAGELTEEEYLKKRISAEEQWLKNKENTDKAATINTLKELKLRLEAVQAAKKEELRLEREAASAAQAELAKQGKLGKGIFDPKALVPPKDQVVTAIQDTVETAATSLVDGLRTRLIAASGNIFESLKQSFGEAFGRFIEFAKAPENFGIASIIVGAFTTIFTHPIFVAGKAIIAGLIGSFGGLLSILRFVAIRALGLTVPGALVLGIFLNWDLIVATVGPIFAALGATLVELGNTAKDVFTRLQETGVFEIVLGNLEKGFGLLITAAAKFLSLVKGPFEQIVLGGSLTATVLGNAMLAIVGAFGDAEGFADALGGVLIELSENFEQVGYVINVLLDNILSFGQNAAPITDIFGRFQFEKTIGFVNQLAAAFFNMLPVGLQDALISFRTEFIAFFEQGRLGGELLNTLTNIFNLLKAVIVDNADTWKILGAVLATIIAVIVNLAVSIVQSLGPALPFIEQGLTGLVQAINGVIQFITGFVQIIGATASAIIGLFTGDFTAAQDLFLQGVTNMNQGAVNIIGGMIKSITNAVLGGWTFLTSISRNFVNNIILVLGDGAPQWLQTFVDFLDGAIEIVGQLGDRITEVLNGMIANIMAILDSGMFSWTDIFWAFYDEIVGNSVIPDLVAEIGVWLGSNLLGIVTGGLSDAFTNATSSMVQFGVDMIGGLVEGIQSAAGRIGETISGLFSGGIGGAVESAGGFLSSLNPFGGGEEAAPDTLTPQVNAMSTVFTAFVTSFTTGTTQLALLFGTFVTNADLAWTTGMANITLTFTTFTTFFTTTVTNMGTLWQTYNQNKVLLWTQTLLNLTTQFTTFFNFFQTILNQMISLVQQLIATLIQLGDTAIAVGETFAGAFEEAAEAVDELDPILKNIAKLLDKVKAGAEAAAAAISGMGSGLEEGGFSVPSAQGGAFKTFDGLWRLHEDEMVIPAPIARPLRDAIMALRTTGIHGLQGFSPALAAGSLIATPAALSPADIQPRPASGDVFNFENHIYNQQDERRFVRQVVEAIKREVR